MSRQVIPKEVDEAIWALYNRPRAERPTVSEILRRFGEDECGIGFPVDLKERTYYEHLARLRVKREPDHSTGEPAAILATADAIRAEIVGLAKREVRDIKREKKATGVLLVPTIRRLAAVEKMLADIERREKREKPSRSTTSTNGSRRAKDLPKRSRLLELVADEQRQPASPSTADTVTQVRDDGLGDAGVSQEPVKDSEEAGTSDLHEHAPAELPSHA